MKRFIYKSKMMMGITIGLLLLVTSCAKDPIIVTGITLDKTAAVIQVGATSSLTAFLTPADADNQNVTWRSSNQAIATVTNGSCYRSLSGYSNNYSNISI